MQEISTCKDMCFENFNKMEGIVDRWATERINEWYIEKRRNTNQSIYRDSGVEAKMRIGVEILNKEKISNRKHFDDLLDRKFMEAYNTLDQKFRVINVSNINKEKTIQKYSKELYTVKLELVKKQEECNKVCALLDHQENYVKALKKVNEGYIESFEEVTYDYENTEREDDNQYN
jgi:hypothetical protein